MASTYLTPGVYTERLPSGVRAIAGVGTSVAVFLGETQTGPVGTPVRIFNLTDYGRTFGGAVAGQEVADAVRLFYLNGGGEAWVVRVAGNPQTASLPLLNEADAPVLTLTARAAGAAGNAIAVFVDRNTPDPGHSFNLTLRQGDVQERHTNATMDSGDARYVGALLDSSALVRATRPASLPFATKPVSRSGPIANVADALAAPGAGKQLTIAIGALAPVTISLADVDLGGGNNAARLGVLADKIREKVEAAAPAATAAGFATSVDGTALVLTANASENARVRVLPTPGDDAAPALQLGAANGGTETSSAGAQRPAAGPGGGVLLGTVLAANALDALPAPDMRRLRMTLDGGPPVDIDLGGVAASGGDLPAKLADVARRLQVEVRKGTGPAAAGFIAQVEGGNRLRLLSGSQGTGSSVAVAAAPAAGPDDLLAERLGLLAGTRTDGADRTLTGGNADPLGPANSFNAYTGALGLGALEAIGAFNLLLLPGVTDSGVLAAAAAIAVQRRAFLLIDPPAGTGVEDMVTRATGTALPKTGNAAAFFPRIMAPDPLNGGKPRAMPPSGAIAGLYARMDAGRGVWKAPAGTDAAIVGATGLEVLVDDRRQGLLNPLGVNCLRTLPVFGTVCWGARTLKGSDAEAHEYKYVPVSRLALFLEGSLERGLQWVVFEPNDETLWSQIRLNVGAFMDGLFRQGAFAGTAARDAFFVKCDAETTTPTDQALGTVNVIVGFAPVRPAEFVIIKLQQMAGQAAA